MTATPHGVEPRGLLFTPRQRSYEGRFGRLFQDLAQMPAHDPDNGVDQAELRVIAESMVEPSEQTVPDNAAIPSGYVYLGQFIDHDITFDPSSQLQRRNDPEGLIDFRTPRFDLDSVYGAGPKSSPFQYDSTPGPDQGNKFLLERGFDMPRSSQNVALIGDPRNDENGIVSQLHVAFMKLHNGLVDDNPLGLATSDERFKEAQRQAQWHYQWVVVHDFLRRTIGDELHTALLERQAAAGEEPAREVLRLRFYRHKVNPYIPVEFSVAAYRFGHSQVRDRYSINAQFERPLFSPVSDDFRGFQPLRPGWQASWPFFFALDDQSPQLSRGIDTSLAPSLILLQGGSGDSANLALRNLQRGAALGLPSGQAVAAAMGVTPLVDDQLAPAQPGKAPLWFYILREAQITAAGQHLGPVGGRIVGETLLGLLRADPQSYFNLQPEWVPSLPTRGGDPLSFDMGDLLSYAAPDQAARF